MTSDPGAPTNNQTTKVINLSEIESKIGSATPQLRWGRNGKLQQAWQCVFYKGGKPVGAGIEWEDVPDEQ